MATAATGGSLTSMLDTLPEGLRKELLDAFNQIVKNFRERRWGPSELNGGKLCEVVYTILKGYGDGKYPAKAAKPKNMVLACQKLETEAAGAPRSIRIHIPRMLIALYEIRNNRNVGHVGGDVDPNHMDAVCVLQMAKWIMAELVRVLHNVPTEEATAIVDGLADRETPLIWEVKGKKRVMSTGLTMRANALLLLHASSGPVAEADLVSWIETQTGVRFAATCSGQRTRSAWSSTTRTPGPCRSPRSASHMLRRTCSRAWAAR